MVVRQIEAFLEVVLFDFGQGFSPFFWAGGLEGGVVMSLLIVLGLEPGIFLGSEIVLGVIGAGWGVCRLIAIFEEGRAGRRGSSSDHGVLFHYIEQLY